MLLRSYQAVCIDAILEHLNRHRSTLAVLATGLGKTVLACHLMKRWPTGRVLFLAHREELIFQTAEKVEAVLGETPDVEMGEEKAVAGLLARPKVLLASVQTLSRPGRRAKINPADFGLVIEDEAHHGVAASYTAVVDWVRSGNPAAALLGLTATPKRADDLALGQVFESVAFDYGIEAAVDDGWLVPVRQQVVIVEELDFSKVRASGDDLNENDLERLLLEEKILHRIAAPTVEIAGDNSALVFCVTVKHAERMAEILNRYKPRSADFISGETPRERRREIVARYKSGELQFLANVSVFLEGFDAPGTSVIAMGRPTKSLGLYAQVVGRATRPLPGLVDTLPEGMPADRKAAIAGSRKPSMLILDFAGNAGRHKLASAADLLGGKYGSPVREYARKLAEAEPRNMAVPELLEMSREDLDLLEEERERAEARARVKADAEYHTRDVSPFPGGVATRRTEATRTAGVPANPATEKQVNYLVKLGVPRDEALTYSKGKAGAVIDSILKKQRRGA